MDSSAWSQWSTLLTPHPDPRAFARRSRSSSWVYIDSTSLSPSTSRTAPPSVYSGFFMVGPGPSGSTLSVPALDKARSRSRSRFWSKSKSKSSRRSPPPVLEPLSFPSSPILDSECLRSFSPPLLPTHLMHPDNETNANDGGNDGRRCRLGLVQSGSRPSEASPSRSLAHWARWAAASPMASRAASRGSTPPRPPPAHPQRGRQEEGNARVRDAPTRTPAERGTYSGALALSSLSSPAPPDAPGPRLGREQRTGSTLSGVSPSSRSSGPHKLSKGRRRPPLPTVPPTLTSTHDEFPFLHLPHQHEAFQQELEPVQLLAPGSTTTAAMRCSRSASPLPTPSASDTTHSPLEARSECGLGSAGVTTIPSKRSSVLLRHFSLDGRSRSHPKAKRPSSRPPFPPPSSWADVSSPQPSSSTCASGPSTTASTSTSASASASASLSRSGSVSNFSTRWRKWSIRRGKERVDGSGCSSRASLEEEDSKKDGVGGTREEERKCKECGGLVRGVSTQHSDQPLHLEPNPPNPSLTQSPSHTQMSPLFSSTSRNSSKDPQQQAHKRSTSWGDAAVALLRGASLSSLSGETRRDSKERERPKTIDESKATNSKDPEPDSKGRTIIDLTKDDKNHSVRVVRQGDEPTPSPRRAKFTLGEWDSDADADPPSSSALHSATPAHGPSASSSPADARPTLVRRDALISEGERTGRRRWTLANAVVDEGISEAALLCELERLREVRAWGADGRRRRVMSEGGNAHEEEEEEDAAAAEEWGVEREVFEGVDGEERKAQEPILDGALRDSPTSSPILSPSRSPSHTWLAARRALLICRELIQTERHYLAALRALVAQDTTTPPPALMLRYAAEVLAASAGVLAGMEREPSMRGIARAFVDGAEDVDGAYVRWCGVVGGWFVEEGPGAGAEEAGVKRRRSRAAGHRTRMAAGVDGEPEEPPVNPLKRTVSTWRRSMPSIPSLGLGETPTSAWRREKEKEDEPATPTTIPRPARKPTVRDLAILPTQRIMRYVLLYRDLLAHTPPTSSARAVVERAVDAACRIAEKCDRAQNNAAFVAQSSPTAISGFRAISSPDPVSDPVSNSNASASSSRSSSRRDPTRPGSPSAQTTEFSASSSSSSSSSSSAGSVPTSITTLSSSPITHSPSSMIDSPSMMTASSSVHAPSTAEEPVKDAAGQTRTTRRTSMSAVSLKSLRWGSRKRRPGSSGGYRPHEQPPPLPLPLPVLAPPGDSGGIPAVIQTPLSS